MAKGFKFGKLLKEPKEDDLEVEVPDIGDISLDEKDLKITELESQNKDLTKYFNLAQEYVQEIEALQVKNEQLEYELAVKDNQLKGDVQTLTKQADDIVRLTEQVFDLEKELKTKKTSVMPKGFKQPLSKERIREIQTFAQELLTQEYVNFYETLAKKFGISVGSAHNYCKDIKNPNKTKEESSNE